MIGNYVMTEHDCLDARETPDSIGMDPTHSIRTIANATSRPKALSKTKGILALVCVTVRMR